VQRLEDRIVCPKGFGRNYRCVTKYINSYTLVELTQPRLDRLPYQCYCPKGLPAIVEEASAGFEALFLWHAISGKVDAGLRTHARGDGNQAMGSLSTIISVTLCHCRGTECRSSVPDPAACWRKQEPSWHTECTHAYVTEIALIVCLSCQNLACLRVLPTCAMYGQPFRQFSKPQL
jgi:hypothetical protein